MLPPAHAAAGDLDKTIQSIFFEYSGFSSFKGDLSALLYNYYSVFNTARGAKIIFIALSE